MIAIGLSKQAFTQKTNSLDEYVITTNSLGDSSLTEFIRSIIAPGQFVMVGEQHGLKEIGEITSLIYRIAQPLGYNYLCIETDAVAAYQIEQSAKGKNPTQLAKEQDETFPFSIPFYTNYDDYDLFSQVIQSQGSIWGIDQTFMTQFRLNFDHLERTTSNREFKEELKKLKVSANAAFEKAMEEKDFMAPFIFQYSDEIHSKLMGLARVEDEKEVLRQLKKTKEIYLLNFAKQSYLSSSKRARLMKQNFLNYYNAAIKTDKHPKVIFKLGANHVMKGLNKSNVYDIANFVAELALLNGMNSTHVLVQGINGESAVGNPFSPVPTEAFDHTHDFPVEIQQSLEELNQKYFILNLSQLRPGAKSYSSELQEWMFRYDFVILIKDATATRSF